MLTLSLGLSDTDRHAPFFNGTIRGGEGVAFRPVLIQLQELFNRQLKTREFDVAEMPIATYLRLHGRPDNPWVAVPIFPSRFFRHSCVFVNAKAGIKGPHDLRGKKVGVPVFDMAAAVWIRGIFEDDYGLDPRSYVHMTGGLDAPRPGDAHPQVYPPGFDVRFIGPDACLSDMIETGEIDALITAKAPDSHFRSPRRVVRLFRKYRAVEHGYYKRTGIFPIMHTLAIRRDVYEANRWVATSVYKAFDEAHRRALANLVDSSALTTALPWMVEHVETTIAAMGRNFWVNGIEPNRVTIDALQAYMVREGLMAKAHETASLFAPEVVAYLGGR